MTKTRASSTLGEEVILPRGALLPDVASPIASSTAAMRSATAAVATTAGTTGVAAASSAAVASTLTAFPAAATALGAPATAATTSSRTSPAALFTRKKRFLGRPRRPLRSLLLGQGGVPRTDHTDDRDPVAIFHCLQRCLDMAILIRQRANEMPVQGGVRDSHSLLSHLAVRVFERMKCLNGVAVGGNGEVVELII